MLLWEIITVRVNLKHLLLLAVIQMQFTLAITFVIIIITVTINNNLQFINFSFMKCFCARWEVSLPHSPAVVQDSSCRYTVWALGTSAQLLSSGQKWQTSNVNTWLDTSNISVWGAENWFRFIQNCLGHLPLTLYSPDLL